MIASPLAPSYRTSINIRPVKHAYFVLDGDWDGIRRVVRLACTQWGGIRSLLIPVDSNGKPIGRLMEQFLRLHDPDLFIDFAFTTNDFQRRHVLTDCLNKIWPDRKVTVHPGSPYEDFDRTAHVLSVAPDEITLANLLTVHKIAGSAEQSAQLSVTFGELYPGEARLYRSSIRVDRKAVRLGSDDFWRNQSNRVPLASVINLTGRGIITQRADRAWLEGAYFNLCVVSSVPGLCLFWNLRATDEASSGSRHSVRRTWLVPSQTLSEAGSLDAVAFAMRTVFVDDGFTTNVHVAFHGWDSADEELLQQALDQCKTLKKFAQAKFRWTIGTKKRRSLGKGPLRYVFSPPWLPQSFLEGAGRLTAPNEELSEGTNELRLVPPTTFTSNRGVVMVDIATDVWARFPRTYQASQSIKPDGRFSKYGVSWQAHVPIHPSHVSVSLPSEWDTLRDFMAQNGFGVRPSPPSRYGSALVALIGGMESVRHLATPAAYRVMQGLASRNREKLAQELVREAQRIGGDGSDEHLRHLEDILRDADRYAAATHIHRTYDDLKGLLAPPPMPELLDTLATLCSLGVVRRGLDLRCQSCALKSWHPIGTLNERMSCPGCSCDFPLPVREDAGATEIRLRYTLNSLADRVMDQDVLPSILALHCLTRGKEAACIVPGLELTKGDRAVHELDFVFVTGGQIHAGECKSRGDLREKDLAVARVAASIGINHYYFANPAGFGEQSISLVESLQDELSDGASNMSIQILGAAELLPVTSA